MDQKFFQRASWVLDEMRLERYPNSSTIAKHFNVSQKTASRVVESLKADFDAPIDYHSGYKGFFLTDTSFNLPFFCDFSRDEIDVMKQAVNQFAKIGKTDEAEVLVGLLRRGGVED